MRSLSERLALRCVRFAEQAEREVAAVYDDIDMTHCRVPRLEAHLLRVHCELAELRRCARLPALLEGSTDG